MILAIVHAPLSTSPLTPFVCCSGEQGHLSARNEIKGNCMFMPQKMATTRQRETPSFRQIILLTACFQLALLNNLYILLGLCVQFNTYLSLSQSLPIFFYFCWMYLPGAFSLRRDAVPSPKISGWENNQQCRIKSIQIQWNLWWNHV